jgi:trehalose 2-sulfotransferase
MPHYSSYVICGTPRSGSTLLCEMLAATGVAGRPNSYYRAQSVLHWAERWGLEPPSGPDDVDFDRRYLPAMLREGRNGTGTFGLRLMWGSMADASRRLDAVYGGSADIAERFEEAFGATLYIHLSRLDKVAQAVSLVRAEQSGLWHLAADGSVFEGTSSPQPVAYDGPRIGAVFNELKRDDAAWDDFFARHQIEPLRLTYEAVTADPHTALARILVALGRDPEIANTVAVGTAKMANATSLEWSDRFRKESGLDA